jgi:cellulose synthase/poly-beta-1,6-N-acetylglucosamine synthase-like glycosyltransferase
MISIVITTKKEPLTLPNAIEAILNDISNSSKLVISQEYEVLVIGPDVETEKIVINFQQSCIVSDRLQFKTKIKYIKDQEKGKPAALNLALQEAQGDILVLTDGDVWIKEGSIQKLISHFSNQSVGAVTGRPVAINCQENIFGYWAKFLTDAADWTRKKKAERSEYLVCSGYLYAFRNVIKEIPQETLVEDGIISQIIWQNSYKIAYEPEAIVYVKFPTNFSDWIKQKIRSTGGYAQHVNAVNDKLIMKKDKMRGFAEEVSDGLKLFFTYPKNPKEFFWTILLYFARLYLWLLILVEIKILKKTPWERVESTK